MKCKCSFSGSSMGFHCDSVPTVLWCHLYKLSSLSSLYSFILRSLFPCSSFCTCIVFMLYTRLFCCLFLPFFLREGERERESSSSSTDVSRWHDQTWTWWSIGHRYIVMTYSNGCACSRLFFPFLIHLGFALGSSPYMQWLNAKAETLRCLHLPK